MGTMTKSRNLGFRSSRSSPTHRRANKDCNKAIVRSCDGGMADLIELVPPHPHLFASNLQQSGEDIWHSLIINHILLGLKSPDDLCKVFAEPSKLLTEPSKLCKS